MKMLHPDTSVGVSLFTVILALLTIVLVPVFYHLYYGILYVIRTRRNAKQINKLPGPTPHWLYGNLDEVRHHLCSTLFSYQYSIL